MWPTTHFATERLCRHRHEEPYAALVIEGGYVEAGDRGHLTVQAGDVVIHGRYEAHRDAFHAKGAVILNFPVDFGEAAVAHVDDPDAVVRLAERDFDAACELLASSVLEARRAVDDWPDRLCGALSENPDLHLGEWAVANGLAPQSVSCGFRQVFGITPKRFRCEQRALRAVRALPQWPGSSAALAADLGFADQAHMTRSVASLTGKRPSDFRLSGFKIGHRPMR